MIKKSFTLRVLITSFLLIALPLIVDAFVFFQETYYEGVEEAKRKLKLEANFKTLKLLNIEPVSDIYLRELIYILDLSNQLESTSGEKIHSDYLSNLRDDEFQLYILKIENDFLYKIVGASNQSQVGTYFFSYPYLKDVVDKGTGTFLIYAQDSISKRLVPYIYTARSITSKQGDQPIGIIMSAANIENKMANIISKAKTQRLVSFALINVDGIIFAATDPRLKGEHFSQISLEKRNELNFFNQFGIQNIAPQPLPVIKGEDPSFFEFVFKDRVQIAYSIPTPLEHISLISYSSKEVFFKTAIHHFLLLYSIYGLILIIGGGVTYWISLWISRPLMQLTYTMTQVGYGKLDARFKEAPLGFEINILGNIFNNTLSTLLKNIQYAEDERVRRKIYEKEVSIIQQIQRSLYPENPPKLVGAEIAGKYLSAADVGGDYFSYLTKRTQKGEDVIIISVVDIAGRGLTSCLYAHSARALFRTHATLSDDVGEILSLSNNAFIEDAAESGMYITMMYGMYYTSSKQFMYYACGNTHGFVKNAQGEIIPLVCSGPAMGLKQSLDRYPTESVQLKPGDNLILYTKGLIKAKNEENDFYTENRLKKYIVSKKWETAQSIVDEVTAEILAFTRSQQQNEEIIIVALVV